MRIFSFLVCALLPAGVPLLAAGQQPPAAVKPQQALEDALQKQLASIQRQQQAIRRQLGEKAQADNGAAGQFIEPMPALGQAPCPSLDSGKLNELVVAAAVRQSLDPALLTAVIRQESAFQPCAISVKGALGLMQLMPETAREMHVADVFNPEQNIRGGAAYLRQLLDRYKGDLRLALIGYNAGPGRADQPSGPYPLETQNYVASILSELGLNPAEQTALNEKAIPLEVSEQEKPSSDAFIPAPSDLALPVTMDPAQPD